jgi:O-antigen/teichoic acid export membrane protein
MFKDLSMRIFLVHLAAFAASVVICATINLWLKPGTLWFPWVLLGWGVAVATHALALLLRKTRRRKRLFVYIAVVLLLAFVNLTVTPKVWWFYWVALGWGVGVGFHLWCAFGKRRRRAPRPETSRQVEAKQPATEAKPAGERAPRQRRPKA